MPIVMYERIGFEGRRPSPFSWRIRYALMHKGADVEYLPTRFADVGTIEKLSRQKLVPIIVDGTRVVNDSWNIARYLEEKYPDRPTLFGDESAQAATRFLNIWSDTVLMPIIRRLISADFLEVLVPEDRPYFRASREAAFGQTLEAAAAARPELLAQLEVAWLPVERLLGEQEFIAGREPRYGDYIFFSVLQWARLGNPHDIVKAGTSIARWRSHMSALFDGLADRFPSYPMKHPLVAKTLEKKAPTA
jgi:glutathione S-transferase